MKTSFLGDISFNDRYKDMCLKGMQPFDEVSKYLASSDYIIGNLECLPESAQGVNELRKPRLKTNLETLEYLNQIGINVVSLANNHVYDNLEDGFDQTIAFLKANNIEYLGAGKSAEQAAKPLILEHQDTSIGLLAYVTEDTHPNLPNNCPIHLNFFDAVRAKKEIKDLKNKVNQVIVMMHWGGRFENGYYPDYNQPIVAKNLIKVGADIIVGHHSHTLQPKETIDRKSVYYSLGNFCFDDVIFEGKKKSILLYPRFRKSAILTAEFKDTIISSKLQFIENQNLKILLKPRNVYFQLRCLLFKLIKYKPFWNIYAYYFSKIRPYIFMITNYKNISFLRSYFTDSL